jgi:outer membrane autotransporter protein
MKVNKMNKKFISTSILLAATTIGASANAQQALDGFYVSGKIGSSSLNHTIERNIGDTTLPVQDTSGVTTANDAGVSFGGAIGYTYDLTDRFFVGAEGFFNFENANTRNINSVLITDIDLEYTYGGRALLGTHVTDNFSLYAHGGLTVLDFDINNSYTFAPPTTEASGSESAFSYGLGAEVAINENFSLFTEYTMINDVDFAPIAEIAGNTGRINPNDLDLNSLSFGIKYNF